MYTPHFDVCIYRFTYNHTFIHTQYTVYKSPFFFSFFLFFLFYFLCFDNLGYLPPKIQHNWASVTSYLDSQERISGGSEVNDQANLLWPLRRLELKALDLNLRSLPLSQPLGFSLQVSFTAPIATLSLK